METGGGFIFYGKAKGGVCLGFDICSPESALFRFKIKK